MLKPTGRHWLALGLVLALVWAGCGLIEPGDSTEHANRAPDTILTAAPPAGGEFGHIVNFHWKGEDEDGVVLSYDISIDDGEWVATTATDTILTFSVLDDAVHKFAARAIDDDGAIDASPAERSFTATSIGPETVLLVVPEDSASVGQALTLELDAEDPDDQIFEWRHRLDDGDWSEWQAESTFVYADPEILEGALGIFTAGYHVFYGQTRDASGLIDPTPESVTFLVEEGTEPTTAVPFTTMNEAALYTDYSIWTDVDNSNDFYLEVGSSADAYSGVTAGYSYIWTEAANLDQAEYSEWSYDVEYTFEGVAPGDYWVIVKASDTAGNDDSSPESLFIDIVDPRTELDENAILLIQETRDGNAGISIDETMAYYDTMMGGRTYTNLLYTDITAGGGYVSPGIAGQYGLIIWITDDSDHFILTEDENGRFLDDYVALRSTYSLESPTHLLVSHWDMFGYPLYDTVLMENVFGLTDIASNVNDKSLLAAEGAGPLAGTTLEVNGDKLPRPFGGKLNKVWVMTEPEGATVLTTFVADDPADTLNGLTNAYYYPREDVEVVITGYPLFFMKDSPSFMDAALQALGF